MTDDEGAIVDERRWIHVIQKGSKKAAAGNSPVLKECLQDIAEEYYDDIYRFCAFQTGNREDAYDLAQETFLRFIRYVESYHDRNLKGYLLTIAMNVCRNYMAEKRKERSMMVSFGENRQQEGEAPNAYEDGKGKRLCLDASSELSEPECHVIERDVHGRLMGALSMLPEVQREAILLHYMYGMKYREIGKRMGVTVSTVKSRVKQGMDKLQGILKKEDF